MSYDLRFMLVALSSLAALYWMVAALKLRLLGRPGPGTACRLAAVSAFVALVALSIRPAPGAAPGMWRLRDYSAAEHDRVDSLRLAITPVLEQYRLTHGRYPDALEDAGIQTPETAYGPLHYYGSRSETPAWYLISFGDPKEHGFEADWDSRKGQWQVFEFDL